MYSISNASRPFFFTTSVAIAACSLWTNAAVAQLSTAEEAVIRTYQLAIKSAESGTAPGAIEAAFASIDSVREALMHVRDDGHTVLESLPEAEYTQLERRLPGLSINRREVVYVELDDGFFSRLATSRGDAADQAFFDALKSTFSYSVWPIYIEQQTDYSGCTRFGSMALVWTYRVWYEFRNTYPDRYVDAAGKQADAVLGKLTGSACACDDAASVEHELEQFINSFSASPDRAKVDERLRDIRYGRVKIRANCISG